MQYNFFQLLQYETVIEIFTSDSLLRLFLKNLFYIILENIRQRVYAYGVC